MNVTEVSLMLRVFFPTMTEADAFAGLLSGVADAPSRAFRRFTGTMAGRDVTVVITGPGQANSAAALASELAHGTDGMSILGGCAGAFTASGLSIGSVALATEEVYAGLGVDAPGGFLPLAEIGLPLFEKDGVRYYDTIPLPAAKGIDASALVSGGVDVTAGRFLTVTTVTGTTAGADALYARYGALCENMEGAAAAQVALMHGARFFELRGISNMAVDRDRESWDIPLAATNCAHAIKRLIEVAG